MIWIILLVGASWAQAEGEETAEAAPQEIVQPRAKIQRIEDRVEESAKEVDDLIELLDRVAAAEKGDKSEDEDYPDVLPIATLCVEDGDVGLLCRTQDEGDTSLPDTDDAAQVEEWVRKSPNDTDDAAQVEKDEIVQPASSSCSPPANFVGPYPCPETLP